MKSHIRFLFLLIFTSAFADSPFLQSTAQLTAQRDQALKAAAEPINRRYKAALETLLRHATQANDLDAAILVRKELEEVAGVGADAESFKKALLGSKWSWIGSDNQADVVMTFHEDGTVNHRGMNGTWKITGPRDVKINSPTGGLIILHFDEALNNYSRVGKDPVRGNRLP